jgi:arginase
MAIDAGSVAAEDVALVGARNLDPPEVEFIASSGIRTGPDSAERVVDQVDSVYVALDCDVFDPGEVASFMPEPGGLSVDEVAALFARIAARTTVVGAGLTGLTPDPMSVGTLERLCATLGL